MKIEVARPMGLSAMLVAVFLIVVPFLNIAPDIYPWKPAVRDWRFGAFGYMLSALTMPTLGLGLIALGGVLRGSKAALRTAYFVGIIFAAVTIIGAIVFVLDGMALRDGTTDPRVRPIYTQGVLKTMLISLPALPAMIAVALGSRRGMKEMEAAEPH